MNRLFVVATAVVLLFGAIFIPRVLYSAVIVLLGTFAAVGTIHYLLPVFSRRRRETMRWGGSGPRMSRLSLLLISALLACCTVWVFQRGFAVRKPDAHYLFFMIVSLIILVVIGRRLDTGRWSS